jgi:hypothetical protein
MKSLYKFSLVLLFSGLFSGVSFAQSSITVDAETSKFLRQTFTMDDFKEVILDVGKDDVVFEKTKGSRVIIETSVKISTANFMVLEYLANRGRYDFKKSVDNYTEEVIISACIEKEDIVIKGETLKEEVKHVIYIPQSVFLVDTEFMACAY